MLSRALSLFTLLTVAAAVIVAQQPAPGFADPLLGRWDLTVQAADSSYPSWLEVMLRKETELMGRFVGQFGSNRHLAEITYEGGELVFRVAPQYERRKSDLVFRGKLVGDRLEGTTDDGTGKTLKWTGARAPALVRTAAPTWGAPIDLFNGKDLSGWKLRDRRHGSCWTVAGGAMANTPPCADFITERVFTDFQLHVEFNIVAKSNSGIYLRGRHEVQINDDFGRATDSLRMGGVYGFIRPELNASGKPGEWQTYDLTLVGRRVSVTLNGKRIINDAEIPGITGGALDSNEGEPGPLMLQGDHGKVSFRKVVITPAM